MSEQISEAFDLIRQYAVREGWIPIGWRDWHVGPWRIRVNGTKEPREDVPPYHALVEHEQIIGLMLLNPYTGTVGGWYDTEAEFIDAMRAELAKAPV